MRVKAFAVLICCLLATACPAPCDVQDREIAAIHRDAAPLVRALEKFKQNENKYPRSLDELAPKYLDKVPQQIGSRQFSYWTSENGAYNLRVYSAGNSSYSGACSLAEIEDRRQKLEQK